jgi:ABC-type molybdate transport system substrate-binding protein
LDILRNKGFLAATTYIQFSRNCVTICILYQNEYSVSIYFVEKKEKKKKNYWR